MTWKKKLAQGYVRPADVAEFLALTPQEELSLNEIVKEYPMRIPEYYLSLIDAKDPNDPIRRMSVPMVSECEEGGECDTSGEEENTILPGMQHKYPQTVMILSNNQCAMYCRHCFRKRMVGLNQKETVESISDIANYVRAHTEINNVLISGGDALMNSNEVLRTYLELFAPIEHLDFIRFGTRIPVVLPQRITEDAGLLPLLEEFNQRKQIFIVTQFNHPKELTPEALQAVEALRKVGCIVRNQTVLLKGVNDNPDVLAELMNRLTKVGVIPYYIFQCRPARGVKNQFQVPLLQGSEIVEAAKRLMSGQAKGVRHVMAHVSGKIEIIGKTPDGSLLFKYHQAKDPKHASRMFQRQLSEEDSWLEERVLIE